MVTNPQLTQPVLFDRALQRQRWQRSAPGFSQHDALHRHVAQDVSERLSVIERQFATALVFGHGSDLAVKEIMATAKVGTIIEAAPAWGRATAQIVADDEALPFAAQSLDLIVSLLSLHTANDLPGALVQMRRALKPDGLLIAALLGGQTLHELRRIVAAAESDVLGGLSPRIAPFADVRDLGGLLQRAGFALPVADSHMMTLTYRSPLTLLADLRGAGCSNALIERSRRPFSRGLLTRIVEGYAGLSRDGVVPATFEIVTLTGWAPHASQQKPLKPGSAQARLADALGSIETTIKSGR
jgi:NADH dehydrogenase [ubiquinone] 1 alpha subcomplex assembly factor 5